MAVGRIWECSFKIYFNTLWAVLRLWGCFEAGSNDNVVQKRPGYSPLFAHSDLFLIISFGKYLDLGFQNEKKNTFSIVKVPPAYSLNFWAFFNNKKFVDFYIFCHFFAIRILEEGFTIYKKQSKIFSTSTDHQN